MTSPTSPARSTRRRWFGVLALAAVGLFAVNAAFAGGFGHRGSCAKHGAFGDDPAAHASFAARKLADRADATEEQEVAIEAILVDLFTDLQGLKADKETFRAQVTEALTADQVDPDRLEELRAQGLAKMDGASREVTVALAEVAAVLTPEQRLDLAEQLAAMHERFSR